MPLSVSVIVPVYNAAGELSECLDALTKSAGNPANRDNLECIVVDDGSTDSSPEIAHKSGAAVLSTGGRKGPAFARNLGARAARGDILFFIDADVCVHSDTLDRVRTAFDLDPLLDALIGSYDDAPASQDFLSIYKNLMHHFTHQTGRREAFTFWSGCGAIRRQIFLDHDGFDESFKRPSIEDIELGYRLRTSGKKLVLDPAIQGQHLKKWTFFGLLKTDILDRGIPWTELILRDGSMPNDLNLQQSQRVSVALVFLMLLTAVVAAWRRGDVFVTPVLALLWIALGRYWIDGTPSRASRKTAVFILVLTAGLAWLAWTRGMPALVPPLVMAYGLLFLRDRWQRPIDTVLLALMAAEAMAVAIYLPKHPLVLMFFGIAAVLIGLNHSFYRFLAARRGVLFAIAAIPFHLLYHFYNGFSFGAGLLKHFWKRLITRKTYLN